MIYLISDTHWNHNKICELAGRPENYQELITKNWNDIVKDDDLVVHLGDVIFSRASELSGILDSLNGRKVLVRGNHDHERTNWYLKKGFSFVCDSFIKKGMLFSHEPMEVTGDLKCNIHGHLHSEHHRSTEDYPFYDKEKNILISIEENFSPVLLDDIITINPTK